MKREENPMVLIPGGDFQMGAEESEIAQFLEAGKRQRPRPRALDLAGEMRQHRVVLHAFYMDVCEVTLGQYRQFLQDSGHRSLPEWMPVSAFTENSAVVGVSWDDAAAYCVWADKRLPTEAEWEKAARGGVIEEQHSDGNIREPNQLGDGSGIHQVGGSTANGYGLRNMVGNVWEWCADWYDSAYYVVSTLANPTGPSSGVHRVVRGGAWNAASFNVRIVRRNAYRPESRCLTLGFRCVRDVSAHPKAQSEGKAPSPSIP